MFTKILKLIDYIITKIISIIILIIILFGSYCLYDSLSIYNSSLPYTLKKYKPKINNELNTIDSKELKSINGNIIGWITINNTNIDYPFVKSSNLQEYLNKDIYNNYSISGSIFLDPGSDINNNYLILYGHNMKNGSMFGNINKFIKEDYYNNHQEGIIIINNKTYKLQVFALTKVNADNKIIYNPNTRPEKLKNYLRSNHIFYQEYPKIEKILAMSTCTTGTNQRLVLFSYLKE